METNYLVLVRHGQSVWNQKNLFTGWKDPGLTELGKEIGLKNSFFTNSTGWPTYKKTEY